MINVEKRDFPQLFILELRRTGEARKEFCERAKIGEATLRRLLNGSDHEPDEATLKRIIAAFGWEWDWINQRAVLPESAEVLMAFKPSGAEVAGKIQPIPRKNAAKPYVEGRAKLRRHPTPDPDKDD